MTIPDQPQDASQVLERFQTEVIVGTHHWRRHLSVRLDLEKLAEEMISEYRPGSALTIMLSDDETVKQLNHQFAGKNDATDVLSFEGQDEYLGEYLGDIIISYESANVQPAGDQTKTNEANEANPENFELHVLRLAAHGILHLLGWDHDNEDSTRKMKAEEEKWLNRNR